MTLKAIWAGENNRQSSRILVSFELITYLDSVKCVESKYVNAKILCWSKVSEFWCHVYCLQLNKRLNQCSPRPCRLESAVRAWTIDCLQARLNHTVCIGYYVIAHCNVTRPIANQSGPIESAGTGRRNSARDRVDQDCLVHISAAARCMTWLMKWRFII
jgi:hypothetical protein